MKTIMHLIICGLVLWLVSCAPPKAVPVPNYRPQAPVPEAADPQPFIEDLRKATAEADRKSAVNQERSEALAKQSGTLRDGISEATAEADRLRQQKSATEKELDALWKMLATEQARANELFYEAEKHRANVIVELQLRQVAEIKLEPLQRAVIGVTNENHALRLQIKDAEAGSKDAHESAAKFHQLAAADKARADKLEGAKTVWRNIAFGFIASTLVMLAWLVFKPRFL
jgi:hypothetical protein